MKCLLLQPYLPLASVLARGLRKAGVSVEVVANQDEAEAALRVQTYDFLVVDVDALAREGPLTLRDWGAGGLDAPILLLTAPEGPNVGGDLPNCQTLSKPYDFNEFVTRTLALAASAVPTQKSGIRVLPTGSPATSHMSLSASA